jgi:signal transduction histidine kinase
MGDDWDGFVDRAKHRTRREVRSALREARAGARESLRLSEEDRLERNERRRERRSRRRNRELNPEERAYQEAARRAENKLRFVQHLVPYVFVVLLLSFLARPVAVIVALAWGVGLASHFFRAFVMPDLRKRWIRGEVEQKVHQTVSRERLQIEGKQLRSLEELSASIAHEIRNPITAAKSLVQQMGEDPTSTENVAGAGRAVHLPPAPLRARRGDPRRGGPPGRGRHGCGRGAPRPHREGPDRGGPGAGHGGRDGRGPGEAAPRRAEPSRQLDRRARGEPGRAPAHRDLGR